MTRALPLFHRIAGQPVIVAGSGEAVEARRRLVANAGGVIVGSDDVDARLAFLAGEGIDALAHQLRVRGVLVNVTDRPELCDFIVPAIVDRHPVQIAIGTGGASAGLAKALRLRFEALLPASLGKLAEGLAAARGIMRQRWPDPADRRRMIDTGLAAGGALDPMRETGDAALHDWLTADLRGAPVAPCEVLVTSDDPEDLTLRAARLLGQADRVFFEPDIPAAILARARADAVRQAIEKLAVPHSDSGLTVILRR